MSHHGTPGGPHPGDPGQQPQEPWGAGRATDPYGQPADAWPGQETWGRAASSTPPDHQTQPYDQGYQSGPVWTEPGSGPPDDNRGIRKAIILVAALAVLILAAGAAALYALRTPSEKASSQATTAATGTPAVEPTAAAEPAATTPGAEPPGDARFVKTGQCVKNESPTGKPKLAITTCGSKTYEVVARFDGATNGEADAKAKCANVPKYTDWYYFNSELDTLDFVLCLKLR